MSEEVSTRKSFLSSFSEFTDRFFFLPASPKPLAALRIGIALVLIAEALLVKVEGCFFIFICPKKTRKIWFLLTVGMHIGIMNFLGLHVFGAIMCAILIAVFRISAEPIAALKRTRSINKKQEHSSLSTA